MSQRSFFWPRHGSPHSDSTHDADDSASKPLRANRRPAQQYPHTRLPSNTGTPIAAVQASSLSSHSSSPSPTPSLNPYGGSLRSMLNAGANPTSQSPTRTSFESGARSRAAVPANALPANIRRVPSDQARSRQKTALRARQEAAGIPGDAAHSLPLHSA
ncbi:hypothetical protein H4R20_007064, partial [Coemansia guatemalensis]